MFLVLQYYESSVLSLETKWIVVSVLPLVIWLTYSGIVKKVKVFGIELEVAPSKRNLSDNSGEKLNSVESTENNALPADYVFINHTSFLRDNKQHDFQAKTKVKDALHYDIRVILDSYYKGALERINYVQYYLHRSYPEPIQTRSRMEDKFCLKEIANGEYVLVAKVFFKDFDEPLVLERYITLWNTGPKIEQ